MPAIVFHTHATQNDPQFRIAGMIEAGRRVRNGAPGVANANQASHLVAGIVHDFIPGTGSGTGHARLQTSGGEFKIAAEQSPGKYDLDNGQKLHLRGDIDETSGNTHKMVSVIPAGATGGAWAYISDTVVPDVLSLAGGIFAGTVQQADLQNYLIGTFTFTRCR